MKFHTIILFLLFCIELPAQQVADTLFVPQIHKPAYAEGKGPAVYVDEGHHNFHTREGRYSAFSKLLERDGYKMKSYKGEFEPGMLDSIRILVISNALHESNVENWYVPTPSAFSQEEIAALKEWVGQGGSLFLIADHMPMAGAAEDLAEAFGFTFTNGFAMDTINRGPAYFRLDTGSLQDNTITRGRNASERVTEVVTFTGQAFRLPDDANSILTFDDDYVNLMPDTAWVFDSNTPKISAAGWSQGAFKKFGKGRIAVFGEAAMFTAQLAGPNKFKIGMNHPRAQQNYQLLLNLMHWLDGNID